MPADAELPAQEAELPAAATSLPNQDGVRLPSDALGAPANETHARGDRHTADQGGVPSTDRVERIHRATTQGGLLELPHGFGDRNGDWQCVLSDDPFEVLFLDRRQHGAVTEEMLLRHFTLLNEYWNSLIQMMDHNNAKAQVVEKFGGAGVSEKVVRTHPARLRKAYDALSAVNGIENTFQVLECKRRDMGQLRLRDFVHQALIDGLLDPAEMQGLVEQGRRSDLTDDEIAAFVTEALREGEFVPMADVSEVEGIDRLLATEWMTPARRARAVARMELSASNDAGRSLGTLRSRAPSAPTVPPQPRVVEGSEVRGPTAKIKIRVHDLAAEFGVPVEQVMGTLREMNIFVRSHVSALEPDHVAAVRARWEREKRSAGEVAEHDAKAAAEAAQEAAKTAFEIEPLALEPSAIDQVKAGLSIGERARLLFKDLPPMPVEAPAEPAAAAAAQRRAGP